jgi:hypothetical protein
MTLAVKETLLFAGTVTSGIIRSTDFGANWTQTSTGVTSKWITAFAVDDTILYAGAYDLPGTPGGMMDGGVFRSTDNGAYWAAVNSGLMHKRISSLAVHHTPGGAIVYAGTYFGTVYRSTNRGAYWTSLNAPLAGRVSALVLHPPSSGAGETGLFAATSGIDAVGVFLSTNNGMSWNEVNAGLTSTNVLTLLSCSPSGETGGSYLLGGTDNGLFILTDKSASWVPVDEGMTGGYVRALGISATGAAGQAFLLAGNDSGVWRRPLQEIISSVDGHRGEIPDRHILLQNYPNPFNPSTTIRYDLPHSSEVQLTVSNTLGQQITTLFDGEQETGRHEVRFDAMSLPTGVYFYRLKAGSFTQTKKAVLLR